MAASKGASTIFRSLLLTGCVALWGCTTTVHDLAVAGVSVTDSAEWFAPVVPKKERTNRILLRVDLTSQVDFSEPLLRWDMPLGAKVRFCSHPDDFALLGGSLYTTTPRAGEYPRRLDIHRAEYSGAAKTWTYYLPLNIAVPPRPSSKPPEIGVDLLNNPEDICISLRGASLPGTMKWRYVSSNTVRLSSAAIREALSDSHPPDRPSNNR